MTAMPSRMADDDSAGDSDKCLIAVQAVFSGIQDTSVRAQSAAISGGEHGVIAVRIGRVLVYLEDRDALASLIAAVRRAVEIEDTAFGRRSAPAYQPAGQVR